MSAPSETIRIDVRHCDCTFGREKFFLSADLVLDPPGRSVVAESRVDHDKHYPTHIQSWTFRNGVASKEFPVQLDGKNIKVRLTFAKAVDSSSPSYTLGIEIWESEDTETDDPDSWFSPRGRSLSPRQVGRKGAKPPLRSSSPFAHSPSARAQTRQRSLAHQEMDEGVDTALEQSNVGHLTPEHIPSTSARYLHNLVTSVAHTKLRGGNDTMNPDPPTARSWSHYAPGMESSPTVREYPPPRFASPERYAGGAPILCDSPYDVLLDDDADAMQTSALRRLNGAYETETFYIRAPREQSTSPTPVVMAKRDSDDCNSGDERRQTGWRRLRGREATNRLAAPTLQLRCIPDGHLF
ncbi:hypothetical protein TRAPUB_1718 [Trametes pubescens]|uniref:Uncharacterized protein n=1 Tax=Trametes pubescens TaxID=154538 RepID=A0A1M2VII7_TRAPU|nr:hypothetical protein TRAPUB_1718 [Trametes pubescens]